MVPFDELMTSSGQWSLLLGFFPPVLDILVGHFLEFINIIKVDVFNVTTLGSISRGSAISMRRWASAFVL